MKYNIPMRTTLAIKMRPQKLDEVIAQEHLKPILKKMVDNKELFSLIFYGPSGTGKTTIASCLVNELGLPHRSINATTTNKKELDLIFEESSYYPGNIVIVDEIHRLNKDKQDLFLSYVEDSKITLIGLTTQNPYFSINPALRSRVLLLEVKALTNEQIETYLETTIKDKRGLDNKFKVKKEVIKFIAQKANGDLRLALNFLEMGTLLSSDENITIDTLAENISRSALINDKDGDGIYDLMSAFQKSIRGSDVQAALYYLGLLISANDLDALERRLIVTAYEDIGLANPSIVQKTLNAVNSARLVGFPEARIILANIVIELALSPKSKSAIIAIDKALAQIEKQAYPVPAYLKLTPVNLAEEEKYDYGGYDYWHKIQYLPDQIKDEEFYLPWDTSSYEVLLKKNYENQKKTKRVNSFKPFKK